MMYRSVSSPAIGRSRFPSWVVAAVVALASTGSLPAHAQSPERNAPTADQCSRRRAFGLGAGAALGGGAALLNFTTTTLMFFSVPESPSAPVRATLAGALFGAGAGLLEGDDTESCRRRDGTVRQSATNSTNQVVRGIRVRVSAPALGSRVVTQWVIDRRADTLVLGSNGQAAGDTVLVALDDISHLEIAHARGIRPTPSVLVGGALGAVAGAVLGYNQAKRHDRICFIVCDATPTEEVYFGVFDGVVAGAAVGLFINRFRSSSEWTNLPLGRTSDSGRRFGFGIAPTGSGVTLSVTLR